MNPCELKISNDLAELRAEFKAFKDLMKERDVRYTERFASQKEAIQVAEGNAERWRLSANEWRAAMNDRERNFMTKAMGFVLGGISIVALSMTVIEKIVK